MYLYYLLWQWRVGSVAKNLDREENFDLVHHITWGSLQLGSGLWRLKKPIFFGPVGGGQFTTKGFESYFGGAGIKETARVMVSKLLEFANPNFRVTLARAKGIFVSNFETAEMAKRGGGRRVTMLSDIALSEEWRGLKRAKHARDVLRILWVGRLLPRKGLKLSLEALAKTKGRDWTLTIVGDGPVRAAAEQQASDLGIAGNVTFAGQVTFSAMQQIYLNHDVLLATPLRESAGVQLAEALASGLPIVTLDLHGAKLVVTEQVGFRIPVTTPEQTMQRIAEQIDVLLESPDIVEAMSLSCMVAAEQYFWDKKIKKIEAYYRIESTPEDRSSFVTPAP